MNSVRAFAKFVLPAPVWRALSVSRELGRLAFEDLRYNVLGQRFPIRPRALSFMANDICNSRCQMCLIYKQKRDVELSPVELGRLLKDPLFADVRHVGVTGGEPTLRKDLPELFEAICSALPRIGTTSIITNAIQDKAVIERVLACSAVSRRFGAAFSVMVSLDGLGEVHDTVRGRQGNFASAMRCIEAFQAAGVPTSFGCTITASNAEFADELLDWAIEKGLPGRFRAAEYIDRLYNNGVLNVIRSFDARTRFHLGLFFYRLEHSYETSPVYQKTYRNVRGMLAEGLPRQIGCPHQTHVVVLDARGELLYCSPKSPKLGSVLTESAEAVYRRNIGKREQMIATDCNNCIHDYPAAVTFREKLDFWRECRRRASRYDCVDLVKKARALPAAQPAGDSSRLRSRQVLIVGWYGTETVGDKAILWSVVNRLRSRPNPPEGIMLATLYPFVSRWTVQEMGLAGVRLVETYTLDFEAACETADEVVVGGGPLMDLEALNHMLYAIVAVHRRRGAARIEGCGLGPLSEPKYVAVVGEMIRLSQVVELRDEPSSKRARQEFRCAYAKTVDDPAIEFVEQAAKAASTFGAGEGPYAGCFLRAWGSDYAGGLSNDEYAARKASFERGLAALVAAVGREGGLKIRLLPMHCFEVGGDDRGFGRRLAKQILAESGAELAGRVSVERLPITPVEIVSAMKNASFNVCMRFHSVVFAETLGVPYVAIDYTGGGKIHAFLAARNRLDALITMQDVISGGWQEKLMRRMGRPAGSIGH